MINCDVNNSSYRVASTLVNAYRDPENAISDTGYSRAQVYTTTQYSTSSHTPAISSDLMRTQNADDEETLQRVLNPDTNHELHARSVSKAVTPERRV